ncbi:transposable element Tcb1 transposase [Trichonephila clavipes]|nr:transposable element Tcb1 transposase [Trichonephila clavipes]
MFSETWLDNHERVSIPNFDCCVQFKRPCRRAAGVAIYHKQKNSHVVTPHMNILIVKQVDRDEVEKLAYQLNEEAERTERPIRRLSKMMYGRTCADMQVDVMGECLSSIKHVVGTTSGCFYPRSKHWEKLEEGRSVTSVAAEFGIAHSIVSRLWRQFQTTGTAIRGFSSDRPRGTPPADNRYIVLQVRRNRRQTAGGISRHTTQATGRPISRFTVARRLHGGVLFARRPVRCVPLTPAHRRMLSLWCREHRNWRDNEWGRVLFTDSV